MYIIQTSSNTPALIIPKSYLRDHLVRIDDSTYEKLTDFVKID